MPIKQGLAWSFASISPQQELNPCALSGALSAQVFAHNCLLEGLQ
jgi:hypothetical protein